MEKITKGILIRARVARVPRYQRYRISHGWIRESVCGRSEGQPRKLFPTVEKLYQNK